MPTTRVRHSMRSDSSLLPRPGLELASCPSAGLDASGPGGASTFVRDSTAALSTRCFGLSRCGLRAALAALISCCAASDSSDEMCIVESPGRDAAKEWLPAVEAAPTSLRLLSGISPAAEDAPALEGSLCWTATSEWFSCWE
eukprot:363740-Chlamydomonas_euryale.AAC.35